jgi:large subunit ribosomal protein L4
MKSLLSLAAQDGRLVIVEDFDVESGKTRDLVSVLKNLVPEVRTVLVLGNDGAMLRRAGRNIPWLRNLAYDRLSAHELFYAKRVILTEGAANALSEFYGV